MHNSEYYRSERFIWDRLREEAARGIPGIYKTWKIARKVEPFIIGWPAEAILDDNGVPTEDTCLLSLPEDQDLWSTTLLTFAQKTKAYALLLAEQLKDEVRVVLESHHGTRSWSIPILVSGDIRTLGTAVVKDDTHRIGILWNRQGQG
jgi:hypothetical protein